MPATTDTITIPTKALHDAMRAAREDRAKYSQGGELGENERYASFYEGMILAFERVAYMAQ